MTRQLYHVTIQLTNKLDTYNGTPVLGLPFPYQLPVVASSFSEAIDRVRKEYGDRCIVRGVSIADSIEGMNPLL